MTIPSTPNSAVETLLDVLDLEPIETDRFRGKSPQNGWQRVYGGQVIGQALVAASRSLTRRDRPVDPELRPAETEPRLVHSLHAYFLLAGDPNVPIFYEVERIRDGGSFSTRRVLARQHGQPIFSLSASFQRQEKGMEHQIDMPDVPRPDELMSDDDMKAFVLASNMPQNIKNYWMRERPIEFRPVSLKHYLSSEKLPPEQPIWIRCAAPLPDDPALHACVLAYMSDMTLLDTSLLAHGTSIFSPDIQVASLDHAMWFHRPFNAHEWMLYAQDSPSSTNARGFTRGSLFKQDGTLIASVAQEGLIRPIG